MSILKFTDGVTTDEAILHMRIDHADDYGVIETCIAAAEASVIDYLGIKQIPEHMPAPVRAAILLRVGDLYENREAQTDRPLHGNQTFERLLNPYRVMEL